MNRTIPDAAVEAVADALEAHYGPLGDPDEGTLCDCGAVVAPVGEYGVKAWREHVAGAVLAAALPLLAAAPSAEQCGAWGGCSLPHGHNLGRADIPMNHRVPSATREDVTGIINDAAFEGVEYDRAERVAAYLHARFTITPRTDR